MLTDEFFNCLKHDGIVSVASADYTGKPHIANTWNKYLIVTADEKLLIPAFGFRKTEANIKHSSYVEITIGSHEVQGKIGLGTGFLLTGTADFYNNGEFFTAMHDKCPFCNRVLVFTPSSYKQTI